MAVEEARQDSVDTDVHADSNRDRPVGAVETEAVVDAEAEPEARPHAGGGNGHRPYVGQRPGDGAPFAPAVGDAASGPNSRNRSACTAPQLKRFIKSRVYVPMHELRRRFQIEGTEDDVAPVQVGAGRVYVGLPDRESRLLGELLRSGDVGYELSQDPPTPIVVGLYPMRPIPRP